MAEYNPVDRAGGGEFIPPHVANIEFGKAGEVEDITKMVKGIASWEFPKEKSLAEYNPESGTQTPPFEKNKLTLNEYLGEFFHFESLFFFLEPFP